jgi:hypothetical protein
MNENEKVDRALSEFFRAEAPKAFPPVPAQVDARPVRLLTPSHYALAAGVLLMLGLGLYLSQPRSEPGGKAPVGMPGLFEGSTADGSRLRPKP